VSEKVKEQSMVQVDYDEDADVLYVRYSDALSVKGKSIETAGVLRRYGEDGSLVGVTILDFADQLQKNHDRNFRCG